MKRQEGNLKSILISEKSQAEVATYSLIPTMLPSEKGETMNIVNNNGYQDLGWKEG